MRQYIFKLTINEGNDEFWESIDGTGYDVIKTAILLTLEDAGFIPEHCTLTLKKYQDINA